MPPHLTQIGQERTCRQTLSGLDKSSNLGKVRRHLRSCPTFRFCGGAFALLSPLFPGRPVAVDRLWSVDIFPGFPRRPLRRS